jgi:hypothetical protein
MASSTFVGTSFMPHKQNNNVATSTKNKKGKKIVIEEEKVLCISFLHIFQDPMIGNG